MTWFRPPLFIVREIKQALGMYALLGEGVKQLVLDSLQAKQGIVIVLHFQFLFWRGALHVMMGGKG